jgi:alkylhydroperoxidase family enzyme
MADRLPPVTRESLAPSEQAAFDSLTNLATKLFGDPKSSPFTYARSSDGALVGPFPLYLAAPDAGEHAVGLFGKLGRIPGLPADAKEVAILTVGAHYKAAYELYAHVNVATKKAGMSKDVVEAIARGEKPDGLNEGCSVAFDATAYLVSKPGPLPKELWDRCIKVFGKEGTVALVHYVGGYAYTCIVLNAMDAPVPDDGE